MRENIVSKCFYCRFREALGARHESTNIELTLPHSDRTKSIYRVFIFRCVIKNETNFQWFCCFFFLIIFGKYLIFVEFVFTSLIVWIQDPSGLLCFEGASLLSIHTLRMVYNFPLRANGKLYLRFNEEIINSFGTILSDITRVYGWI